MNIRLFISLLFLVSFSGCTSNNLAPYSEQEIIVDSEEKKSEKPQPSPSSIPNEEQIIPSQEQSIAAIPNVSIEAETSNEFLNDSIPPVNQNTSQNDISAYIAQSGYICENAGTYRGKSIGNGECVDLIKRCTGAPLTRFWKPGDYVFGKNIPSGTAIATFRKGKYPNKHGYHAAIYSHQDENGIYAWDQWRGKKVHLRYIKANQKGSKPGNNATQYQVIIR